MEQNGSFERCSGQPIPDTPWPPSTPQPSRNSSGNLQSVPLCAEEISTVLRPIPALPTVGGAPRPDHSRKSAPGNSGHRRCYRRHCHQLHRTGTHPGLRRCARKSRPVFLKCSPCQVCGLITWSSFIKHSASLPSQDWNRPRARTISVV
jgi:hypothetical protein